MPLKPTSPWSVKGVDPEAREAAKIAARRAGVPLGLWLSHTIRNAAATELKRGAEPAGGPNGAAAVSEGSIGLPAQYGAAGRQMPAPTIQAILDTVQRLSSRVESMESSAADALGPIVERVDKMAMRIEEVSATAPAATAPVERALVRLSQRLDEIEARAANGRRRRSGLLGLFRSS